jgi:acyl-CoA thioesterase-1
VADVRFGSKFGEAKAEAGHSRASRRRVLAFLAAMTAGLPIGSAGAAGRLRLVALGDSLSAGYLLPANDAFPARLEAALRARGHYVSVENAGVSGDTATGGLDRLDWSVGEGTHGVILELGANDALRGIDPAITEKALDEIITRLKARRIGVLLAGMLAPRNNGRAYVEAFDGLYARLAKKHGIALYPFFLDGVMGNAAHVLADQMHPNAAGVRVIVERILPSVEAFLKTLKPS